MPQRRPPTKTLYIGSSTKKDKEDNYLKGGQFTGNEDDDELIAEINNRRDNYLRETRSTRRQWLVNAAFARGHQWSRLHRTDDRLVDLKEPGQKRMITVDLIGPWKEHMTANMVTAQPMYEVIPSNTEPEAVSAARLGKDLLIYYWESWQFVLQYIDICNYILDFGNAFLYVNYKEDFSRFVARELQDPETGEIILSDEGVPAIQKSPIGDVYITVLPPHNIFCPINTTPIKDKQWMGMHQRQSLDYFRQTYKNGDEVTEEIIEHKMDYHLDTIQDGGENIKKPAAANEIIYFQKPSNINSDGIIIVIAGNVMLSREKWPYNKMLDYPFEHFKCKEQSGEFFARSWIERQIPIQKLYNVLWSILTDNADDMGHQKLAIPNTAGVNTLSDIPEVIRYNPPYKPEFLQVPSMPEYIVNMIDRLEMKMHDVQNYHGASMGTSVSGVRSDIHAQNLQDQDMLPLTTLDNMMRSSFESLGEKILLIASEKLEEERMIQFVGENKRMTIRNFKGAMLGNTRKVKVRMTNTFMRSKNATTRNILQMYQIGGITDQFGRPDTNKLLKLLEFALPDSIFDEMKQKTETAYQEIENVLTGKKPLILPWQDQKMFVEVLTEYMNSSEFIKIIEASREGDVEAKRIFSTFYQEITQRSQILSNQMSGIAPRTNKPEGRAGAETQKGRAKPETGKG